VVEGGVVYNENRLGLGLRSAMVEKLLNEVFVHVAILYCLETLEKAGHRLVCKCQKTRSYGLECSLNDL
jgi:hypothetical protein